MPGIIAPSRRISVDRPSGAFFIDPTHRQAFGLKACYPLANANFQDISVNSLHLAMVGNPSLVVWSPSDGVSFASSGASNYARVSGLSNLGTLSDPFTLSFWSWFPSFPPGGIVFSIGTGSAGVNIDYASGSGVFRWTTGSGGGVVAAQSTGHTDFQVRHTVLVFDGSNYSWYHNGVADGSGAASGYDTGTISAIGLNVNSNVAFPQGLGAGAYTWDFRWYKRALSADDVVDLYRPASRWSLYWQPMRRVVFDVAAVATTTWPGYQAPWGWN